MTCAILVLGAQMTGGAIMTTPDTGRYLMDFDVGAHNGRGPIPTTVDATKAKHFEHAAEALEFWRTQSRTRPLRPDGEPNRPLTAFTIEIVRSPE